MQSLLRQFPEQAHERTKQGLLVISLGINMHGETSRQHKEPAMSRGCGSVLAEPRIWLNDCLAHIKPQTQFLKFF